ncbi:transposase [Rhizobium mesoamericanum]|uniref:transposase n=1 Tax=Rhizobium TaxID=379 RepID=UPI0009DC0B28
MRVEILGQERRRRWRDEQKLEIVMSVGIDGATVTDVAQRHDVTRQQIYTWRSELNCSGGHERRADRGLRRPPGPVWDDRVAIDLRSQPSFRRCRGQRHPDAAYPGGRGGMIGPGTGVRVYLACGITDMRNYAATMIMRSRRR